MSETSAEKHSFNPEHDTGDEECSRCGNPKWQKACVVCSTEMSRLDYRKSIEEQSRAPEKPAAQSHKEKPEIPKDPQTGKPQFGPGSDRWEESKRKYNSNKKTA